MVIEGVINTEQEYNLALDRSLDLFDSQPGDPEYNEFQVLLVLIKDYEDKHFKIPFPDPIEAIKYKLQEFGLKNKDLIPIMGSEGHVSAILSGRRKLTLDMAKDLNQVLGIPADVLLAPTNNNFSNISDEERTNQSIEEQLNKSRERILKLKELSAKLKGETSYTEDELNETKMVKLKDGMHKQVVN